MAYQIPESAGLNPANRFEFEFEGETFSVPKVKFLRPAVVRRLETLTQQQVIFFLLDEFAPDLVDRLDDMGQVEDLYRAWASASGIDLGEPSGSSVSSTNTAEPHEETSSSPVSTSTTSAPSA